MAIPVYWDNAEKTIIRWDLPDHWTIAEIYEAAEVSFRLRQEQSPSRTVYRIITASPRSSVPVGALTHVRNLALRIKGTDKVIRVGGSPLQRMMDKIFLQMFRVFGDHVHYADTIEQARALVVELDKKIAAP